MRLRTRLLLLNSLVLLGGTLLALLLLERYAGRELRDAEEQRLLVQARLLAERAQIQINTELINLETWADMPLVVEMARNPGDDALRAALVAFLQGIVEREQRYSIYLFSRDGECIASDDPRRIGAPQARDVVAKRPSMKRAFAGESCIGRSAFSIAAARPLVSLSASVRHNGEVVGVLRTAVDMVLLQHRVFPPDAGDDSRRVYIHDPDLDTTLPSDTPLIAPDIQPPWRAPPPFIVQAGRESVGEIYYNEEQGRRLLIGSARMNNLAWVVFVTYPMDRVLAPLSKLHGIAIIIILALSVLILTVTMLLVAPVVLAVERCRNLVDAFREGLLDRRIALRRRDEIGELASGLNRMAETLESSRRDLAAAEREYRTLFENSIEGIFRTDVKGTVIIANAAMADILGVESTKSLFGMNVIEFYANPADRERILDLLQQEGRVDNEAIRLVRRDGVVRDCMIFARAERDTDGALQSMQGILIDVTEKREAEKALEKARETERLLAEARWLSLRYQINPHFVFNVLTSIDALSREAPERIPDLTRQLAVFLRRAQHIGSSPLTPLQEELAAMEAYLKIEKIRFEEKLQVDIIIPERLQDLSVPDMLLQPLVENAIKFGMATSGMPLNIRVVVSETEAGMLQIEVANTGSWVTKDARSDRQGIGLGNLRNRLALLYPDRFSLTTLEENGWVKVRVVLPGWNTGHRKRSTA
jgi:PAS domain S-box-containing protein